MSHQFGNLPLKSALSSFSPYAGGMLSVCLYNCIKIDGSHLMQGAGSSYLRLKKLYFPKGYFQQ